MEKILLLDEQNIEDMKRFQLLKVELFGDDGISGLQKEYEEKEDSLNKKELEIDKLATNIAKNVKRSFQQISTSDTYYLNYNRTKVLNVIDNDDNPISTKDIIKDEELSIVRKQVKPEKKESITDKIKEIEIVSIQNEFDNTIDLISKSVTSKVIEELKNDSELSVWVKRGLEIHRNKNRKTCAFCGSIIRDDRIDELDGHYNDAFNNICLEIKNALDYWRNKLIDEEKSIIYENSFYDELAESVKENNEEYLKNAKKLNLIIEKIIKVLNEKYKNPFKIMNIEVEKKQLIDTVEKINQTVEKANEIIGKHNNKTQNFEANIEEAQIRLERHYVQEQIEESEFLKKRQDIKGLSEKLEKLKKTIDEKMSEYHVLEGKLSNETLGAEAFNEKLEQFLGHNEIKLIFDENEKGYRIYRNDEEEAKNLSEGEKTAIAFIYFITKLKENGSKIEDSILVIDDPVSSFDSNKLFSAYAYMKSECDEAKQLFVLTHNYSFFSLVLDWFRKKHTKDKNGNRITNYCIYRIDNRFDVNDTRYAILEDGGDSLKQATEYDYIFESVYLLKDKPLKKQEMIFCGNIARKLVESFLSFKFPKQRGNLMSLLEVALPGKENDIVRERIYRFINIYSHEKKINVLEELDTEVLETNSRMVINDILDMIKKVDSGHYLAMVEKTNKN